MALYDTVLVERLCSDRATRADRQAAFPEDLREAARRMLARGDQANTIAKRLGFSHSTICEWRDRAQQGQVAA